MKNVIITGATGFLGYALLLDLIENNIHATVLCRRNSKRRMRLDNLRNIKIIECDLSYASEILLDGDYDTFYHLAWEGDRNDFDKQYRNIDVTLECLKLAAKSECRHFICTGSQAEYGNVKGLITEETHLLPTTAYGTCKVATYYLMRDLACRLGIDHTWVRPFSVYGKHDNPNSLLPQMMEAFLSGRDFTLASDGTHTWNYLHETDAARALRLLGDCETSDSLFNLAGDENIPLCEYAERVRQALNPNGIVAYGNRKSEVNLNVSNEKLKKATGWKPELKFEKENFL
ncbi:NAD(P)-dependent oxidoreductase [Desulfitobacterium sp. THU1]|uniref:NAD-dependent epimerase/dehydratase family protein n=1 Tax=Desulfitobacterium sp. THU1 TaxID=3138072 RepID=UPI00312012D8